MSRKHLLKIIIAVTVVSFLTISSYGFRSITGSLAVVIKVIKEVNLKAVNADWTNAQKGDRLSTNDQLKTGIRSFALVKFLDNSMVRLQEKSELTIIGEGSKGAQINTAHLNSGSVGFTVKKQQNNLFRLTSPTSVASIRGTKGRWSSTDGHDTLIVTEGLVNLRNKVSNKEVDVAAGFIGFSDSDGSILMRQATEQELNYANIAIDGGSPHEMKIELQDSKGNKKNLKLKYKQ